MADPTDVLVRTGLWRFGATRARLGLDGERLTVTSVDPETGQPNALIVGARLSRITAHAAGRVMTLEAEGNPYRIDFAGRGWSRRLSEWRAVLEFAGLPVPYRSMHPGLAVLAGLGISVLVAPFALYALAIVPSLLLQILLGATP